MKMRADFVTNSSSSSFILAREGELSEKQKEAIVDFVQKQFLGKKVLTPESSEEEIQKVFEEEWWFEDYEENQEAARQALKNGKSVYTGVVVYEEVDWSYAGLFEGIWKIMEETGEGSFYAIKDDLSY